MLGPLATAYNTAYFNVPGALPLSNTYYNGKFGSYGGIIDTTRGGILTKSPFYATYDEDDYSQHELTGELRFQTSFDGPLNFSAGAFWMSYQARNQYWVASNGLDFEAIAIGGIARFLTVAAGGSDPGALVAALPAFDAEYRRNDVQSRSAFLEGTYDVIPDEVKVIVGARYNDDRSSLLRTPVAVGGGLLTDVPGLFPIGSTNVTLPVVVRSPTAIGVACTAPNVPTGCGTEIRREREYHRPLDGPSDCQLDAQAALDGANPSLCNGIEGRVGRRAQCLQQCAGIGSRSHDIPAGDGGCA